MVSERLVAEAAPQRRALRPGASNRINVTVDLHDGRRTTLQRTVRVCAG